MARETIALAADHAGFNLKEILRADLVTLNYEVLDLGTHGPESVDYPDFAERLARAIETGPAKRGVLICGSGIGVAIAANRFPWVRAAPCHDALSARLGRQHNDANVLTMGGRLIGDAVARDCLRIFLETPFEGGRHAGRVAKLARLP